MFRLIFHILAAILALWLAKEYVPGVDFSGDIKYLFYAGAFLGLINLIIKPILNLITLPLRILTLGLFSILINMLMVWLVDIFFVELDIKGIIPLFWTTLILWVVSFFLGLWTPKGAKRRKVVEAEE